MRHFPVFFMLLLHSPAIFCQGLVVNEFSNGSSGAREYVEFVVTGPPGSESCATVNINGYLIDDNNGEFGFGTGYGIATGHIRFSPFGPYSSVPTGSIIVVYNSSAFSPFMVADDPLDVNGDSVYIIPDNNSALEHCTSIPNTGSTSYAGCSYFTGGSLSTSCGFRNAGDAAQTRYPNGTYFHGVSYGTPVTGGPDNTLITTSSGTGKVFSFTNAFSDDYRLAANYVSLSVPAGETPGAANTAANESWIDYLRSGACVLPIQPELNFHAAWTNGILKCNWVSAPRCNYEVALMNAEGILTMWKGNSNSCSAEMDAPLAETFSEILLTENGINGAKRFATDKLWWTNSGNDSWIVYPNPTSGMTTFRMQGETRPATLFSVQGKELMHILPNESGLGHLDLQALPAGIYFLRAAGLPVIRIVREN